MTLHIMHYLSSPCKRRNTAIPKDGGYACRFLIWVALSPASSLALSTVICESCRVWPPRTISTSVHRYIFRSSFVSEEIYLGIRYVGREKKVSEKGHAPGVSLTRAIVSDQREHIKRLTSRAKPEARGFYAALTPCAHGHNSLT